jgi:hypothetical protein
MNLIFKNPTLEADFALSQKVNGKTNEGASQFWAKNKYSEEKMVLSIPIGYVDSLFEIVEEFEGKLESNPTLDLTYDTVQHLPVFLAQQYFAYVGSRSFTQDKAIEILIKTFAAYLTLLCINEHGYIPDVQRRKDMEWIYNNIEPDETHVYSWSGHTIKVGDKNKYDLLPEMSRVVKVTANEMLRIRISRVVEIYKRMCGVNLCEKGMDDLEGCI